MLYGGGLKIAIALILVFSLIFFPLHIAKAVSGWLIILKEYVLDLIGRLIARTLLSVMSNGITRTILTSGRDGGPAFVRDWRSFLQTAQYRGEDTTRAIIGDATLGNNATVCPFLRTSLAGMFGANILPGFNSSQYRLDNLQYYNVRNKCTLPANFNTSAFRNDFSNGGWAAWDRLIQPQNNFYGVYTDSLTELGNQRQFEQGIDTSEAGSGSGYTSKRTGCVSPGANQQCVVYGKIVTPADLFGKSGAATIDQELNWLVSSDEIAEALVALTGIVISKLTNFVINAALNEVGPGLGADAPPAGAPTPAPTGTGGTGGTPGATRTPLPPSAFQVCVDACVVASCPPPLPLCTSTAYNRPCIPLDTDNRYLCVTNCQISCEVP